MRNFEQLMFGRAKTDAQVVAAARKQLKHLRWLRPVNAFMALFLLGLTVGVWLMALRFAGLPWEMGFTEGLSPRPLFWPRTLLGTGIGCALMLVFTKLMEAGIAGLVVRGDEILLRCLEVIEKAGNRTPTARSAQRQVLNLARHAGWLRCLSWRRAVQQDGVEHLRASLSKRRCRRSWYFLMVILTSALFVVVLVALANVGLGLADALGKADGQEALLRMSRVLPVLMGLVPGFTLAHALQAVELALYPARRVRLLVACWDSMQELSGEPAAQDAGGR